jgi:hypothetical protein
MKTYVANAIVEKIHGTFDVKIRRVRDRGLRSWYSCSNMASRSELESSWLSFAMGKIPGV